jgi:hypothetical protein
MATVSEVAVTKFAPLLGLLAEVPDPRRAQGQIYKLPHVLRDYQEFRARRGG